MSPSYLHSVLSVVELPNERLAREVVQAFGSNYAWALAVNTNLGPAAAMLVNGESNTDVLLELVWSGNPYALDALLSSDNRQDNVLHHILANWDLSYHDQLRLVEKPMSRSFAERLLTNPRFSQEARHLAGNWVPCPRANPAYGSLRHAKYPTLPRKSTLRLDYQPREHHANCVRAKDLTNFQWLDLPPLEAANGFFWWAGINHVLQDELGTGSTLESRTSWMNFLSLLDPTPSAPLRRVTATARRLAKN